MREREIAELRQKIEDLESDAANDLGNIQALEASERQVYEIIGIERGQDNWPEFVKRLREYITAKNAVVAAAREVCAEAKGLIQTIDRRRRLAEALARLDAVSANDKWQQFVNLLRNHINNDMDQYERWRMKDKKGNNVYIHIAYYPTATKETHIDLDTPPPAAREEDEG